MKNFFYSGTIFLFFSCFTIFNTYASGVTAHMFVAKEVINKIPDASLRRLLSENLDAYLVGASYPDSGYIKGTSYGEESHWDPFIYAFSDYLKATYKNPIVENPKLVAFLFGCASHRVVDELSHWSFYPEVAAHDFKGSWEKAHANADPGIDIFLILDKDLWTLDPSWWIPVSDLIQVYHRLGSTHSEAEIIWGNQVLSLVGYGERLIAYPAYLYYSWKMKWGLNNYYNFPQGGMLMEEEKVVNYYMNLLKNLRGENQLTPRTKPTVKMKHPSSDDPVLDFSSATLRHEAIELPVHKFSDGSVEISRPLIRDEKLMKNLLNTLNNQFVSETAR